MVLKVIHGRIKLALGLMHSQCNGQSIEAVFSSNLVFLKMLGKKLSALVLIVLSELLIYWYLLSPFDPCSHFPVGLKNKIVLSVGFMWPGFRSGRGCGKGSPCPTEPMLAGSRMDLLLARAEPICDCGSASG